MDREKLNRHKKNKRELALIDMQLDKLYERLEDVPVVQGKVSGSSKDFPYIESHMTVQMAEPKAASGIKDRIREKETRQEELQKEIEEVESFITGLPDGIEKQVLEMVYLEDMSQRDAAEAVGYSYGRVSQIITSICKKV